MELLELERGLECVLDKDYVVMDLKGDRCIVRYV